MSSFMEDIKEMRREVTAQIVFHIQTTPELYKELAGKSGKEMKQAVYEYTAEHDNEFGEVFEAELDVLNRNDWANIAKAM